MNMKVAHEINAKDLLSLIFNLESDALRHYGYDIDEYYELSHSMFVEYIEHLASKNKTIQLLRC